MSISFRSGAGELQRLLCFKYYNVLKRESKFTVELETAKIDDFI